MQRMGAGPRRIEERPFEVHAQRARTGLRLVGTTRRSPRSRSPSSAADEEITVGMNDVTPHCDEERRHLADPLRLRRQIDADRAVDLQVDEAGQHRAAGRVDDLAGSRRRAVHRRRR